MGHGQSKTSDVIMRGKDMSGLTAVITGARIGIGAEMAWQMAAAGARVIMAVRKLETGEDTAFRLRQRIPERTGEVVVMHCDLSSLASIRAFAAKLLEQEQHIDIVVLNAAIRGCPMWYSREGFEMQMAVNYYGHFHLMELLLPRLQSQSTPSRVIVLTCQKELDNTTIKLKDLNFGIRSATHDTFKCYKASKIALTLFGKELARRTAETQVTVLLADPGVCGETNLFQYMGPLVIMFAFAKPFLQTLPQAAATPLFACVAPVAGSARRRTSFLRTAQLQSGTFLGPNCRPVDGNRLVNNRHLADRVWTDTHKILQEAVVDSHKANAGYVSSGSSGNMALLVMQWFLKPLMDAIMRAFRNTGRRYSS